MESLEQRTGCKYQSIAKAVMEHVGINRENQLYECVRCNYDSRDQCRDYLRNDENEPGNY